MLGKIFLLVIFCFTLLLKGSYGDRKGVEIINPTSVSQFQCIINQINETRPNMTWPAFIYGNLPIFIRVKLLNGSIDQVGTQNIKNLREALNYDILNMYFVFFTPDFSLDPKAQIKSIQRALDNMYFYYTVFADISTTRWSNDRNANQLFFAALYFAMQDLPKAYSEDYPYIGYYSSINHWNKTFGLDFIVPIYDRDFNSYNRYKLPMLMWTENTGYNDSTGYVSFGGFQNPALHLWNMNAQLCGMNLAQIWVYECNSFNDCWCCGLCVCADSAKCNCSASMEDHSLHQYANKKFTV